MMDNRSALRPALCASITLRRYITLLASSSAMRLHNVQEVHNLLNDLGQNEEKMKLQIKKLYSWVTHTAMFKLGGLFDILALFSLSKINL